MVKPLTNKQLDEMITLLAGEDITPLISLLKNKQNVSEFKIAESLNVTVNQVRNMLYRLYKHNLVEFTRKKDKKKGWYIYYWTLNLKNAKEILMNFKKKQLMDFKERLGQEETETFFVCPNKCKRMNFESAMESDFKCLECGSLMDKQDNARTKENIRQRILEIETEIKEYEEEARLEAELAAKKMARKNKRAEKEENKNLAKKVVQKTVKTPTPKPAAKKILIQKKKVLAAKKPASKKPLPKKIAAKKKKR